MRTISIVLLSIALSSNYCIGQKNTKPVHENSNLRISIGLTGTASSSSSDIKNYLKSAGLGDKVNGSYDYISSRGNDYYPQSDDYVVGFQVAIDRRLSKNAWLGLTIGTDKSENVTGYDRFGTDYGFFKGTYSFGQFVKIKHNSWFLSSQFSVSLPGDVVDLFGGPVATFHKIGTRWDFSNTSSTNQIALGAEVGAKINFSDRCHLFMAYRISGKVDFIASSNQYSREGTIYHSRLPDQSISFNHLKIGLSYSFFL